MRARQGPIGRSPICPPPWHRLFLQELAGVSLVTPSRDRSFLLARAPFIIRLKPPSTACPRPARTPLPAVSRVRNLRSVRACVRTPALAASHSNGPIRGRVTSRVLFPSSTPFHFLCSLRVPIPTPRVPGGRPAPGPLPSVSRFRSKLTERGQARLTSRTVRDDVTGRVPAHRRREGASPRAAIKGRLRARPAQCGRHLGRTYLRTKCAAASEAAGSGAEPPGPRQGRSGSSWAPRPGRRPRERRKGAGGTRPRPAAVMVSSAARPGGAVGGPLEEEAGSREPFAGGLGVGGPAWGSGAGDVPTGPPVGGAGAGAARRFVGGKARPRRGAMGAAVRALWPVRAYSGSKDAPLPSPGPSRGLRGYFTKIRGGRGPR